MMGKNIDGRNILGILHRMPEIVINMKVLCNKYILDQ